MLKRLRNLGITYLCMYGVVLFLVFFPFNSHPRPPVSVAVPLFFSFFYYFAHPIRYGSVEAAIFFWVLFAIPIAYVCFGSYVLYFGSFIPLAVIFMVTLVKLFG